MPQRRHWWLSSIVVALLLVCVAGEANAWQPADRFVIDSGSLVQLKFKNRETVVGRLLFPYTPRSDSLIICESRSGGVCSALDASSVRHIGAHEPWSVAIRGRQSGNFFLLGVLLGGLAGAIAFRDSTGSSMGAGLFIGGLLGGFIGRYVTGWVPLFPCPAHGQCAWRGANWPR
jgi:hypothetical protein